MKKGPETDLVPGEGVACGAAKRAVRFKLRAAAIINIDFFQIHKICSSQCGVVSL